MQHLIELYPPLRPVGINLVLGHVVQHHVHVVVEPPQGAHKLLVMNIIVPCNNNIGSVFRADNTRTNDRRNKLFYS